MANSCCCGECRTLYRVDTDKNIVWTVSHYDDVTTTTGGNNGGQCDVDSNGNIYQVGGPSSQLVRLLGDPQTTKMFTLKSYTPEGALRWGWSEAPLGTEDPVRLRLAPTPLIGCRIGRVDGDDVIVVADNWRYSDGIIPTTYSDQLTRVTCLDTDGNQLWRVTLEKGLSLVAAGDGYCVLNRLPAFDPSLSTATQGIGWIVLDLVNGSLASQVVPGSTWSENDPTGAGGFPWHHTIRYLGATMASNGKVYGIEERSIQVMFQRNIFRYGVCEFEPTATTPSRVVTSANLYYAYDFLPNTCEASLGIPNGIFINGGQVIVYSDYGYEAFEIESMKSVKVQCANGVQNIFYRSATEFGIQLGNALTAQVTTRDLDSIKIWDDLENDTPNPFPASPFADARLLLDGGTIWSQGLACSKHGLIDRTGPNAVACAPVCCQDCFEGDIPSTITGGLGTVYDVPPQLNRFLSYLSQCPANICKWTDSLSAFGPFDPDFGTSRIRINQDTIGTGASMQIDIAISKHQKFTEPCLQSLGGGEVEEVDVSDLDAATWRLTINAVFRCDVFRCGETNTFRFITGSMVDLHGTAIPNEINCRHPLPGTTESSETELPFDTIKLTPGSCADDTLPDIPECFGHQDWISVDDGHSGFEWTADGPNDCGKDCRPLPPVTVPSAAGQHTSTGCG